MYLLEAFGQDDRRHLHGAAEGRGRGACLGGECFGAAGGGFLRLSCVPDAEPDERSLFTGDAGQGESNIR